jgi:hypothetical protein
LDPSVYSTFIVRTLQNTSRLQAAANILSLVQNLGRVFRLWQSAIRGQIVLKGKLMSINAVILNAQK